jgi:DNA ligase-1
VSVYTRTLYQNHGSAVGYWKASVTPDGYVTVEYAKKLDGKPVRRHYQALAKNVGRTNATTPGEQGILEVDSKASLKIDKGYVATEEEARLPSTNALNLLKPMLATPFEKVKPEKIEWHNALVQPKLDGHRALYDNGVLYSRQGKVLNLPHIVDAIKASGLDHLHLDGELYIHGSTLQEMATLIKKQRPETLTVEYHIYDIINAQPFAHRFGTLIRDFPRWPTDTVLKLVDIAEVTSPEELEAQHAYYRAQGYEGTMLRFGCDGYDDGKRSRSLLKLKEFQDAEFTIVGVKEGTPYTKEGVTYQVPIWVCDAGNGETFTCTAQGNMYEKHTLWVNRIKHIGHPLTVKFHYYSKEGIPQLPIALRFPTHL